MTKSLKNIPLRLFRDYLTYKGLKQIRSKKGHEIWSRKDLGRPVVIQSHIDPVPEFIIRNNLRTLGETAQDFYDFCSK
ncbi:MAG: type II toxin-antitoxin system HicA family toxin [Bacteroidales bacterium]|nr:type II toxin-antitoxin system HicA family toxin [Bacteroidales bacterium]